jgi:hypothetical protein
LNLLLVLPGFLFFGHQDRDWSKSFIVRWSTFRGAKPFQINTTQTKLNNNTKKDGHQYMILSSTNWSNNLWVSIVILLVPNSKSAKIMLVNFSCHKNAGCALLTNPGWKLPSPIHALVCLIAQSSLKIWYPEGSLLKMLVCNTSTKFSQVFCLANPFLQRYFLSYHCRSVFYLQVEWEYGGNRPIESLLQQYLVTSLSGLSYESIWYQNQGLNTCCSTRTQNWSSIKSMVGYQHYLSVYLIYQQHLMSNVIGQ